MPTCSICLEAAVVTVQCPVCQTDSHMGCVQEHLVNTVLDAHCPACSKEWSHDFLAANLPKAWLLKQYKKYREAVLLDREKSLLPASQEAATELVHRRQLRVLHVKKAADLRKIDFDLKEARIQRAETDKKSPEAAVLKARIIDLSTARYTLRSQVLTIEQGSVNEVAPDKEIRKFIQPCPAPDCRGFLSTAWKCMMCASRVCPRCGELMAVPDSHECNPDTLASFTLIRRESKSCPNCGVPITKISGCDHMFCVDCKTSFGWRTLEIHHNGNSNPLYWQWRQLHPVAQPEVDLCNPRVRRDLILRRLSNSMFRFYPIYGAGPPLFLFDHRIRHIQGVDLRRLLTICDNDDFGELRVKFLLKEISEQDWRVQIQRVDKKKRKARFVANILELFIDGSLDVLEPLDETTTVPELAILEQQIHQLRSLCNTELSKIATIFGSTCYHIDEGYQFRPH